PSARIIVRHRAAAVLTSSPKIPQEGVPTHQRTTWMTINLQIKHGTAALAKNMERPCIQIHVLPHQRHGKNRALALPLCAAAVPC
ncbi:unnamed protein product, partial [Pylaiella littoralis]